MQGILSHCDKCLAAESEFSTLTLSISPPRIPIPVRTPPSDNHGGNANAAQ